MKVIPFDWRDTLFQTVSLKEVYTDNAGGGVEENRALGQDARNTTDTLLKRLYCR